MAIKARQLGRFSTDIRQKALCLYRLIGMAMGFHRVSMMRILRQVTYGEPL
jgi:hypothetical protein